MSRLTSLLLPSLALVIFEGCAPAPSVSPDVVTTPAHRMSSASRRAANKKALAAERRATHATPTSTPADANAGAAGSAAGTPPDSPAGVTPDWKSSITARLRDDGHRFFPDGDAFTADLSERAMSARFDVDGAVITRDDARFQIGTARIGRPGRTESTVGVPALGDCVDGMTGPSGDCIPRLEIPSAGSTGWWVANNEGLEQGWTVTDRPDGRGKLTIVVPVAGADARVQGDHVDLESDDGGALVVRGLVATDADGQELDAKFESDGEGYRIVVDDADAVYPIEVDPLYTTANWEVDGSDGYGRNFGDGVSAAGDVNGDGWDDVLVPAARYASNTGRVYVFEGSASGLSETAACTLVGPSTGAYFGSAHGAGDVNGDGYDDVIVGATGVSSYTGAAYVYQGSATGLSTTASTTLVGEAASSYFGAAAAHGDVNGDGYADVMVGAYGYSTITGRAYLYEGSASGLSTTAATTLTGAATSYYFGVSISGAGDVNGDSYDDFVITAPGAHYVYVYSGSATGLSSTASRSLYSSIFVGPVAGAGDIDGDGYDDILVGAWGSNEVLVYNGSSTGTGATASQTLSGAGYFGWAVGGAGDVNGDGFADVIVGTYEGVGNAYVYAGSVGGLNPTAVAMLAGDGATNGFFGSPASGVGDVNGDGYDDVAVGEWQYANNYGTYDCGAAWVFYGSAGATFSTSTMLSRSDEYFGVSIADAGDVNGDGYADVIVGAYGYDNYLGEALIYDGSADGLSSTASRTVTGSAADDYFGKSVSGAGDVNGDGFDDVIVGAYGSGTYGAAYVYDGSVTGISAAVSTTITGSSSTGYSYLGALVSGVGDVNDDGYDDVAVGNYPGTNYVHVYHGSSTGTHTTATTSISLSYQVNSVSPARDINGDGYDDILVGCTGYSSSTGVAYLYKGMVSGVNNVAISTLTGYSAGDYFGSSASGIGDINNDGYDDIAVGAYGYTSSEGRVYIYHGSSTGLSSLQSILTGATVGDQLGYSLAPAGDLDGDGYDDLVVGAPGYGSTGAIFTYRGSASGIATSSAATDTITGSANLGSAVASADVNGDGHPDILGADYTYNSDGGAVYAYYGYGDADGDGVPSTTDCDDSDPAVGAGATTYYADLDADTYGDPTNSADLCGATAGYVSNATDCDDTSTAIHPGASEICDASNTDEDCDGLIDDSDPMATGESTYYADSDGDGYGNSARTISACDAGAGYVANSTDCDDTNAAVTGPTTFYSDSDGDGYGDPTNTTLACSASSSFIADNTDCNDASAAVRPGATEVCDASSTDEDCDGLADDGDPSATSKTTFYVDSDRDGYGSATPGSYCHEPAGYAANSTDCNDASSLVNPGASEICDALDADENCNGLVDDADSGATGKSTFYADSDGDGYGGSTTGAYCDLPSGYTATSTDCNDASAAINPAATEVCDAASTDEDCDGLADDADTTASGKTTYYVDSDGDGYGGTTTASRCHVGSGYAATSTDCSDANATINPGATELIGDAIDENCDGSETCYVDADADSYRGTDTVVSADTDCADAGELSSTSPGDCDDSDSAVHSGGTEIPGDGIDEDCDGAELCYADVDGDGYRPDDTTTAGSDLVCDGPGEADSTALSGDCDDTDPAYNPLAVEANCADPNDYNCDGATGYADNDADGFPACEDCDDSISSVNPDGIERCNGLDDDCDGTVDDNATNAITWYADADSDGYTDPTSVPQTSCSQPPGYAQSTSSTIGDDCNDSDATCHPGATDTPDDGIDQDCDGSDATSDDSGDADTDTDTDSGNGDNGDDSGPAATDKDGGCGCASAPDGAGLGLLVLAGVLVRRRRV